MEPLSPISNMQPQFIAPQKSKKGLVIGIIVVVLILIIGLFFALYQRTSLMENETASSDTYSASTIQGGENSEQALDQAVADSNTDITVLDQE